MHVLLWHQHNGGVMKTWKCTLCCFPSQRSIRPQVVTTFELPGCHDMWTVISNEVKEDKKVPQSPRSLTATHYSLGQNLFYLQNGVFHSFSHRLQKAAVIQMMSQRRTRMRMEKRGKKSRTSQRRRRRRTRNLLQRRTQRSMAFSF